MTDLVKRATAAAAHLRPKEYAAGLRRVERLVQHYRPAATCFVGLDGWRCAVDRRARPGWIVGGFGGRPAYLMPSTSGRNARVPLTELAAHLRAAATPQETASVLANQNSNDSHAVRELRLSKRATRRVAGPWVRARRWRRGSRR